MTLALDIDFNKLETALADWKKQIPKVKRRVIGKGLQLASKETKAGLRGKVLSRRSGDLYKSIIYKSFAGGAGGYLRAGASYSRFHENGPIEIKANKKKWLAFKVDDEWKKVRSVVLPKREFMKPHFEDYFVRSKGEREFEAVIDKALKQIFKDT